MGIVVRRACALFLFAAGAAAAAGPKMLLPEGPPSFDPAGGFHSLGHPVRLNTPQLLALRRGDEAEIELPDGTLQTIVMDLVQAHGQGVHSLVGHLKDRGNEDRVTITTGPGGSFGAISTPAGEYRLVPGNGHDWLVSMKAEALFAAPISLLDDMKRAPAAKEWPTPQSPDPFIAIPGVNSVASGKSTPAPQYGVDVMIVVTRALAARLGANLMTRLNFLVTRANTAFADSEVAITLRLVGVAVADFPDSGSDDAALAAISPACTSSTCSGAFNASAFGSIENQRAASGADLVALLRDGGAFDGSGIAWVGQFTPASGNATLLTNPAYMYSVTTGCVLGCESVFIHELGHNMGDLHDRPTQTWQQGANAGSLTDPYAYGYAYCESGTLACDPNVPPSSGGCSSQPECSLRANGTNNFSDLMAYFQGSTLKNYKFASPAILCTGDTGPALACGTADSVDAARAMNERRVALSGIKGSAQTPALAAPSSVQFTASAYVVAESAGSVKVTVSRAGGSAGALQVQFATADGAAKAGLDYTATSGTLSWADGDMADKTITVPILNDAIVEGSEAFVIALSNPTGAAGVFLGQPSAAAVVIAEPWPAGGVAPTGFTGSWAVASDFANDGDGVSFKSAPLAFSGSVPAASSTQFTGSFEAGTISFSYKVDSYPGFGFFEFLVDGVAVVSDSGDSGWQVFAMPIAAGAHTLAWRYRTTLSFPCGTASPAPPQGTTCADRAWMDALSLPALATGPFTLTVAVGGTGTGRVTSSPVGIDCGVDCSEPYAAGTAVTLTATPDAGAIFSGWVGGGCSGTGACTITMNAAANVAAVFDIPANIPRLTGISTRMGVLTGDNVLIGGFVIGGSTAKTIVVRARGPSLGVSGALANPVLVLVPASGSPLANDDWQTAPNAGSLQASGFAPADPHEAAIMATLVPGAYTAVVAGAGGATGVAIVEVFEVDHPEVPLAGISTRGLVQTGDNVMIGGFIVQGTAPKTVVVRARGPSLGLAGTLQNPTLTVVSAATGATVTNDDWQSASNAALLLATGFAPTDPNESALLLTLDPGAYTAIVSGVGGTTGVAIVEVFAP